MITTVTVTQEHIDRGRSCDSAECPIALAVIALGIVPEQHYIGVFADCAAIWESMPDEAIRTVLRANMPPVAQKFIEAFDDADDRDDVEPFSFELTWEAVE